LIKKTLKNEYSSSKKFLKSLKYWKSFPLEDYSIIPKINIELCDTENLMKYTKQNNVKWFKNKKEYDKWKTNFIKNSKHVQERINLYS